MPFITAIEFSHGQYLDVMSRVHYSAQFHVAFANEAGDVFTVVDHELFGHMVGLHSFYYGAGFIFKGVGIDRMVSPKVSRYQLEAYSLLLDEVQEEHFENVGSFAVVYGVHPAMGAVICMSSSCGDYFIISERQGGSGELAVSVPSIFPLH